ncbi:MAG TPA: M48 family metalloprotease [Pyrinomonadaceae bacterium]|nr:M48 family metalloprotease [Pyrinomonadaceae bacterium]
MTTPQDRQLLIKRLEELSRKDPAAYRFRVILVAALGYAYLFAVVLALLALVAGVIWAMFVTGRIDWMLLQVIWIPLVVAGLVLRSMWITIPPPDGKEVQREQAPSLFELVDEVRRALAGPEVHHVLLSDEFNAGIVQVPRFGMFGWTSNYMVIGLPLLKGMGPDEFRAVIAHEFGHLSGKHGRFTGWIYRIRESWTQILTRIEQERNYASFIFDRFIKWYAPYFDAYSFVLARAQEYEADRYAVETSGKTVTARMLMQLAVKTRALRGDLWEKFYRRAGDQPQAPKNPFALMLTELEQPLAPMKVDKWLRQSLSVETGYEDTHPALAERLEGIGFTRDAQTRDLMAQAIDLKNGLVLETAAQRYLREIPKDVTDSYDRLWREQVVDAWKQTHDYLQQARQRLAELDEASTSRPLTINEQWERAKCTANLSDTATALPIAQEVFRQDPNHAGANMAIGGTLLEQEDPAGVEYLEKAMQLDASLTGDACELLFNFYQAQGRPIEAETCRARAEEFYLRMQQLQDQAGYLTVHDRFEPHDLDDDAIKKLQEQLASVRGLIAAYLVRKIPEGFDPFYVLGVFASWKAGESHNHVDDLIDEVGAKVHFSGPTMVISLDVKRFLADTIARVPNSLVYRRD